MYLMNSAFAICALFGSHCSNIDDITTIIQAHRAELSVVWLKQVHGLGSNDDTCRYGRLTFIGVDSRGDVWLCIGAPPIS